MAPAAETTFDRSRRRRRFWTRTVQRAVPYGLILPIVVVIGVILGYPLYWLVKLSTERYGLFELIRHAGVSVGLANYRSVLHSLQNQRIWVGGKPMDAPAQCIAEAQVLRGRSTL